MQNLRVTPKTNQKTSKNRLPVCKFCNEPGHSKFTCRLKPHKPITARVRLKPLGKAGKRTVAAVAKWKRTQPPNHQGYFECYLCHKWVTYLEAEHVKSKARHPDLRTDPNNLKPACSSCNSLKGSNDARET